MESPGSKAPFPFLSAKRGLFCTRKKKKFRSPLDPTSYSGCIDELDPKRNIRPSDRGPASTTTEAELSARCPPAKLAPGSQRASFPALGQGW